MGTLRGVVAAIASLLPLACLAQFSINPPGQDDASAPLRGKSAVDVFPGVRRGLGYPLRYGNVVPGSVTVHIGGATLHEGGEFSVDYSSGVLYIGVPVRDADSIRVMYRHDPSAKKEGSGGALPLLTLNFGQKSSMTMLLGMSGAERFADGRIAQAQNVGIKNNFAFGGATLSGLFLTSTTTNALVSADSASPDHTNPVQGSEGTDVLIKQLLDTEISSGVRFSAQYQNVGSNFSAFGMLQGSDLEDNTVKQLEKEKGITRLGFGLNGGNPKSVAFSNNFLSIDDGRGSIEFQNYGISTSNLDIYYNARKIDPAFNRFTDIAEENRAQLQKEKGIDREEFGGGLKSGGLALKFGQSSIKQQSGAGIEKQSLSFESAWLKASFQEQSIAAGFSRVGDLAEKEREQWARERGMSRKSVDLAIPKGKGKDLVTFFQKNIAYDGRSLDAMGMSFNDAKFSAEYWSVDSDQGFQRIGDLSGEEKHSFAERILGMYGYEKKPTDDDKNRLAQEGGLSRNFLSVSASPTAKTGISFSSIGIAGANGGITNDAIKLQAGNYGLEYRKMSIDTSFSRIGDLLDAEKKLYGQQNGFDRQDLSFNGKLNAKTSFGLKMLDVDSENGGLQRLSANLKGAGFEFDGNIRRVDDNFSRVTDVNDSEKDLFAQLAGYDQYDVRFKFDALKNVKINSFIYDATNGQEDLHRFKRELQVQFSPDSKTDLQFLFNSHKLEGAAGRVYEDNLMSMKVVRDLGKLGILTAFREEETVGGPEGDKPGHESTLIKYETNLSKNISVSTEQAHTNFTNGGYENVQAYKLAMKVTRALGINISQTIVDRDSEKADVSTTNLGFTYDFGNNLRLGYSLKREEDTVAGGKSETNIELGEGNAGGFTVSGKYNEKGREGEMMSKIGNFSISNPKPFTLGPLKDIKLAFGYDGKTRQGAWEKENKVAQFSAVLFGSEIGAGYSHVMMPGHQRAADRALTFKLDPSGKKALQMDLAYKVRTMPNGENKIIRDFDVSYKVDKQLSLVHSTENFPERKEGGAPLGTIAAPTMKRKWAIEYTPSKATSVEFSFNDLAHSDQKTLARSTNVTVSLFNDSGSPLRLTYGVEQNEKNPTGRTTRHQYQIGFDQKPGPNQTLSILMGNVSWQHNITPEGAFGGLTLSLDYQLRF